MKLKSRNQSGAAILWALLGVAVLGFALFAIAFFYGYGVVKAEIRQRTLFEAANSANEARFDAMKKKLPMAAEAADRMMEKLKELYVGYGEARTTQNSNAILTFLTESVPPTIQGTDAYKEFMRLAVAARDDFANDQARLSDINRVHANMLRDPLDGWILRKFGNAEPLPFKVISSSATKETFRTGVEEPEESMFDRKKK